MIAEYVILSREGDEIGRGKKIREINIPEDARPAIIVPVLLSGDTYVVIGNSFPFAT